MNLLDWNKKIWALFFPYLLLTPVVKTQDTAILHKKFNVDQLHEDLDYVKKMAIRWHPAPFNYASRETIDQHFEKIKTEISAPLTEFQFRSKLREAIKIFGCGHSNVAASSVYLETVKNIKRPLFPLKVEQIGTELYCSGYIRDTIPVPIGSKIIRINNIPTQIILKQIGSTITQDGYNITHEQNYINRYFETFYAINFGFEKKFRIDYQLPHSEKMDSTEIYAVLQAEKKTNATEPTQPFILSNTYFTLSLADSISSTFVLDINSFSGKKSRKTIRKTFVHLKKSKAKNLIIDLRDNGGGKIFMGNYLLRYLVKKPVFWLSFYRQPIPLFLSRLKIGFFNHLTPLWFTLNPLQYPSKKGWHHCFFFLRKNKIHYNNNLFVLTNGGTFSMASYTTAYLKHLAEATIVGEETGGGERTLNGLLQAKIKTPNTNSYAIIMLYHIDQRVGRSVEDKGMGVKPDYEIKHTPENLVKKEDLEFKKVMELIQSSQIGR